tara:strand:- start:611 stop:934 length:324 start_codon:yes stop_codon:yes gene_type:complete
MKHPYYDSDRKKRTERFAMAACSFSIIGIVILMIVASFLNSCKDAPEPTLGDFLSGDEKNLLDTLQSIIPNGVGIIEYEDGTCDSIRYTESDEDVKWIGNDGVEFYD